MINLACITITDDMDKDAIMQAFDEPAGVILDARMNTVTETVPELIGTYYVKRNNAKTLPRRGNTPRKIEITNE